MINIIKIHTYSHLASTLLCSSVFLFRKCIYDCGFTNALSLFYKRNVSLLIPRNYDSRFVYVHSTMRRRPNVNSVRLSPPPSFFGCIPRSNVSSIGNGLHLTEVRIAKTFPLSKEFAYYLEA